VMGAAIAAE